ncbi:MAG: sugar ABC transporter permease [Bacilli bacterium]|nr:sugar ABC transporter permease [Bacilli bacterium]
MRGKLKHILKAVASSIIWGLGQVFNKQYLKALFFFLFFVLFIGIELGSSNLISGYDPYNEQLSGNDFGPNLAKGFYETYVFDRDDHAVQELTEFETFYEAYKADGFTNDELIEYVAQDILAGSRTKYYVFSEYIKATNKDADRTSDLYPEEDSEQIATLSSFNGYKTTYLDEVTGKEYVQKNIGTGDEIVYRYVNIDDADDILTKEQISGYPIIKKENKIYYDKATATKFYIEVKKDDKVSYYENITDPSDKILAADFTTVNFSILPAYKGSIWYNTSGMVYVYYNPEINGYNPTVFSEYLTDYFFDFYQKSGGRYDQTDFARFKLKVYFAMHPETKADFEERFDNFFYNRAGFFLRGVWSVITLGSTDSADYFQISLLSDALDSSLFGGIVIENMIVRGHLSSYLLIKGLIAVLLMFYFLIVFIWTIRDAYRTSVEYEKTHKHVKDTDYFKKMYESSFEYILLLPAIFTITFISIMPIVFSFLVAFTSYSGQASDVGLFDWVGFENFTKIFVFGGDIPFGQTFWKVFLWTIIWAIFSTATVFFGGFFQAVIINSERVPLKKFWRTFLILPWAIPAIITQMVFANIFNENGVVNAFLENIGLYDVFKNWGILGVQFSELTTGIQRAFYLGYDNIQWFTNSFNPWFVRITLIVVNIWLGFPYYMALMTGIMVGIDKSLYEAAEIDGAGKQQKFKYITFPLVMYSTAPLLVMSFSGNFNNFGMIYFVTQGGAGAGDISSAYAGDTDILISWMFSLTVKYKNYNMASVFAILIFFIIGSLAAWNYSRTKAFKED